MVRNALKLNELAIEAINTAKVTIFNNLAFLAPPALLANGRANDLVRAGTLHAQGD